MRAIPLAVALDGVDVARVRCYFDARVDCSGGPDACWPWTGETSKRHGYGVLTIHLGRRGKRRRVRAHRAALFFLGGIDPGMLDALHSCDNPPCCNPAHLRAGTASDNAADKVERGRANHPVTLSPAQVAEIRRRYAEGVASTDLAVVFGVSTAQVHRVATGVSRAEVAEPVVAPPWKVLGHINSNGKLTDEDVRAIRHRYAAGGVSQRALAADFGVCQRHVADILSGKKRRAA